MVVDGQCVFITRVSPLMAFDIPAPIHLCRSITLPRQRTLYYYKVGCRISRMYTFGSFTRSSSPVIDGNKAMHAEDGPKTTEPS